MLKAIGIILVVLFSGLFIVSEAYGYGTIAYAMVSNIIGVVVIIIILCCAIWIIITLRR